MTRAFAYLSLSTLAFTLLSACEAPEDPGSEAGTETGDGDGDPTTGDGDGDPGDGDGDPGDGDGDPQPEPDADQDGVSDNFDNCPDDPNPNQRDFDGNGVGNVCEVQVFSGVSGTLNSILFVDGYDLGDCDLPLALEVTAGEVRIQFDDDAATAALELVNLEFAEVPAQSCDIAVLMPSVGVTSMNLANDGDAFPVAVPHSPEAHDSGMLAGTSDPQHPVLAAFTLAVQSEGGSPEINYYSIATTLPVFDASVTDSGAAASLTWDEAAQVIAMDAFTTEGALVQEINFELRGLSGTLDLQP